MLGLLRVWIWESNLLPSYPGFPKIGCHFNRVLCWHENRTPIKTCCLICPATICVSIGLLFYQQAHDLSSLNLLFAQRSLHNLQYDVQKIQIWCVNHWTEIDFISLSCKKDINSPPNLRSTCCKGILILQCYRKIRSHFSLQLSMLVADN